MMLTRYSSIFVAIIFFLAAPLVATAEMSSPSYRIHGDSINSGGGEGSSNSYNVRGSAGQPAAGNNTSNSYIVKGGSFGADEGTLEVTLSATSVNLGTISTNGVQSGSVIVAISTDSVTGYTLSVGSVSGTGLTGVTDGSVTAGTTEFGVAVSGGDTAFSNDQAMSAGLVLASSSNPANNTVTTITFKGATSASAQAGSYSQTVTLAISANI